MSLALEAAAMTVIDQLRDEGIRPLLLKGPTIERWLYEPDERRPAGDVDLLVSPTDRVSAELRLAGLGFSNRYDGVSPDWAEEHADTWLPGQGGVPVDLHRRLWGFEAPPAAVWQTLWARREAMTIGGTEVDVLSPPARALCVALHAAHHGLEVPRPIEDLRRAVSQVDDAVWIEAAELAAELGASAGLAAGLALDPGGVAVRDALGLEPASRDVVVRVARLWSEPRTAEGFLRLFASSGVREATRLIRRELFPSPDYMRARESDGGGSERLARAYIRRWRSLASGAPSGLRAARRLRRGAGPTTQGPEPPADQPIV